MSFKIVFNCLKASMLALSLLFFQPARSQQNFTALLQALSKPQLTGSSDFVVLIGGTDSLFFKNESGGMKVKTVAPINQASQWLTAALVLQAVDEGKLSLDDKVVKYLPVFEKYGKNYITLRHCLAHLTGIRDNKGKLSRMVERKKYTTLEEQVADLAAREIETNPGTAFNYSEVGPSIAGRVLEVVSRKRFDLLIKQKLLTPLGMRQTTFTTLDGSAPDPSGGARSTALDYMSFLKMLLNGGKHNGQPILSEKALRELRTLQTSDVPMTDVPKAAGGFKYALGAWAVQNNGDEAIVLAAPGFYGTWSAVDYCRNYTFLFLSKDTLSEQRSGAYGDLKKLADATFKNGCQ